MNLSFCEIGVLFRNLLIHGRESVDTVDSENKDKCVFQHETEQKNKKDDAKRQKE